MSDVKKITNWLVSLLIVYSLTHSVLVFAVDAECGWPGPNTQNSILSVALDDGSYASGVVIAHNRVLTAAHAVIDSEQVFVEVGYGYEPALILMLDENKDLAVMEVDTGSVNPIKLSRREPYHNERVWAIGFPLARSKTTSVGNFKNNFNGALHTTAPIDSGESGGGLISCDDGHFVLAGMLRGFAAYRVGKSYIKLENHSVSVAASDIFQFVSWNNPW